MEFGFINVFTPNKPCKSERERVSETSNEFGTEWTEYMDFPVHYTLFDAHHVLFEVIEDSEYSEDDDVGFYEDGWEPSEESMWDMDASDFERELLDYQEEEEEAEFAVMYQNWNNHGYSTSIRWIFELDGEFWLTFGYDASELAASEELGSNAALVLGVTGATDIFVTFLI